jgi:PEP-CTERM motif-containing protein
VGLAKKSVAGQTTGGLEDDMNFFLSQHRRTLKCVPVFLILMAASFTAARADIFTIVPAQSSLTLSGSCLGIPFSPQPPDGFNASYSGTIDATLGPGSIKFNSASADAIVSGVYQPGLAPGDYGVTFVLSESTTVFFSIRNYVFSLSSPTLALVGGAFDANGLSFAVTGGNNDYDFGPFCVDCGGSPTALTGQSASNGGGTGSLSTIVGVQTLTIPIDVTITYTTLLPNDTTYRLMGNIVAIAVPEPSTWTLLVIGAMFGFIVRRKIVTRRIGEVTSDRVIA